MHARATGALLAALACCNPLWTAPFPRARADEPILVTSGDMPAVGDWLTASESLPRWTVRVGTVILERSNLPSQGFIYNVNSGATILNSANFDFPLQGGLDVAALRRGSVADIGFRYFGIAQGKARQGPILIEDPGATFEFPGLDPSEEPILLNEATYGASLHSVELNLRKNVAPRLTLLAGFRHVSFSENFFLNAYLEVLDFEVDLPIKTRNQLYGAQIGADAILWDGGGPLYVEGSIKGGVYANVAQNRATETAVGIGDFFSLGAGRDHTAFVGDVNFTAVYQLDQRWAVRAGYQLLWLAGVAVVADQPPQIDLTTGSAQVDTSGSVLFHGAMLGLERSW